MKDYSNYHNINTNEKISHDGLLLLEKSLSGFEGHDVTINETVQSKVLIYQKWDANSQTKKVIGRIDDIEQGNLFKIGDLNWLVTTFPEDNKIYRKAEMQLCNSIFPIQSDKTKVLIGNDHLGRPVYDEQVTPVHTPCVVESQYSKSSDVDQFLIPSGKLVITMKYQVSENLKLDYEFDMYQSKYKITDIDYTTVINDKGIIKITAEKVV